ncbi:UNVERIFIED_CONTAM: hypothetical protein FKN15_005173 [Acipenser sinensis]
MDLKVQMAQVLELLARQQAPDPAPARAPEVVPALDTAPPLPMETQDELELVLGIAEKDKDAISLAPSWVGDFLSEERGTMHQLPLEAGLSSEISLDTGLPSLSNSTSALVEKASAFLNIPWKAAAEPLRSIFRTQGVAVRLQPFPT